MAWHGNRVCCMGKVIVWHARVGVAQVACARMQSTNTIYVHATAGLHVPAKVALLVVAAAEQLAVMARSRATAAAAAQLKCGGQTREAAHGHSNYLPGLQQTQRSGCRSSALLALPGMLSTKLYHWHAHCTTACMRGAWEGGEDCASSGCASRRALLTLCGMPFCCSFLQVSAAASRCVAASCRPTWLC